MLSFQSYTGQDSKIAMSDPTKDVQPVAHDEVANEDQGKLEAVPIADRIKHKHADLYGEALERYGNDGDIDPQAEKKLKR